VKASPSLYRISTWLLLAFVFGLAVFPAKTQAIAHDEALTYEWFLQGSVYQVLRFNSTNHILFTLLAKLAVKLLGLTEFTLRLPGLIGAAAYLAFAYLLWLHLFGEGPLLLVSVGLLSLNLQMPDFMAAARGYILAAAFLTGSLYVAARAVDRGRFDGNDRKWRRACVQISVLLALSTASNLTNAFPAVCLMFCFSLLVLPELAGLRLPARRTLETYATSILLPGFLLGSLLMWPFLIQARPAHFHMGNPLAADAIRDWFKASFLYKWTGDVYSSSLGAVPPVPGTWPAIVSDLGV